MTGLVALILVVLLLVAALRMGLVASRLDRLHKRTEAAWAGLEGALARRIGAVRALAAAGVFTVAVAKRVRLITAAADRADRAHRAEAENDLSRTVAELTPITDPDLATELADAAERVTLARRFYNDAVRDTRALRASWFTRAFRLAGRAALPDYFEIAEAQVGVPLQRSAARVVLVDHRQRVLLQCFDSGSTGRIWLTPGGGLEPGETHVAAAVRELREETGLVLRAQELAGPLWRRHARFVVEGTAYNQEECYFAAIAPAGDTDAEVTLSHSGLDETERRVIVDWRWWTVQQMRESAEPILPAQLPDRIDEVFRALHTLRASRAAGVSGEDGPAGVGGAAGLAQSRVLAEIR